MMTQLANHNEIWTKGRRPTYQRRLKGGWWYLGLGRLVNDLLIRSPREDRALSKPEFSVGACLAQEHDFFFMATGALPSELRN